MNELIKIQVENNKQTVLGRDVYTFLEVQTPYTHWMKRMFEYGFAESLDYVVLKNEQAISQGLTVRIDHQITLNMAKEISMIQRTAKGKQARLYFIECENKLLNQNNNLLEELKTQLQKIYRYNDITKEAKVLKKEIKNFTLPDCKVESKVESIREFLKIYELENVNSTEVYREFTNFCKEYGYSNVSHNELGRRLKKEYNYTTIVKRVNGHVVRMYEKH